VQLVQHLAVYPDGVTGTWSGNLARISGTPTVSGVFNYTVITTGGCPPASTSGTITVNPQNTITAASNQTVCINSPITNVIVSTTGATGATFSGLPLGVSGSWESNVVTISGTPTESGVFNYTITTAGGCPPASTIGSIVVTPQHTIEPGTNQTVCMNSPIAPINLITTGATGAIFNGLPAGVNGTWSGNIVTITGTPIVAGTYNYTISTVGQCTPASTTGTIIVDELPLVTFIALDTDGCAPLTTNLVNTTENVTSTNCVWSIQNGPTLTGCNIPATFANPGCYNVTLTVTSSQGCVASSTVNSLVCVQANPVASFFTSTQVITPINNEVQFINSSTGAITYLWNFGDGNTSTSINPTHAYLTEEANTYNVMLVAYSSFGCSDTAYMLVIAEEEIIYYVPNTFTPDGNPFNPVFLPIFTSGFDPFDYHLTIFNRWGEIMFESFDSQFGWDGTYGGKIVPDGTYIWTIEFGLKANTSKVKRTGHVNVLR
jgi:gliding motility-associated-like protein